MDQETKNSIIARLREVGAVLECPRCANKSFNVAEGYLNQPIQGDFATMVLGGPSIPSVVVVCDKCGFMSQHALGILGLLPSQQKEGGK